MLLTALALTATSLGVAEAVPEFASEQDLVANADQALYKAKETGRNRVCLWRRPRRRSARLRKVETKEK